MKLSLSADWSAFNEPFDDSQELVIGGYYAQVYDRGDYMVWQVKLSSFNVADQEIADGSVDSGEWQQAKDAAETAIARHAQSE